MFAAISGNVPLVKKLVEAKADLEATILEPLLELNFYKGHTALTLAASLSSAECVSTLIELKADMNAAESNYSNDALAFPVGSAIYIPLTRCSQHERML